MGNGKLFENLLSSSLTKITDKEEGFFIKSPTPFKRIPMGNGEFKFVYSQKALCDFIGIIDGKFIVIEAKTIQRTRFDLKRLKEHQIKQLSSIKRHGGHAFIFFEIKMMDKIIAVNIKDYLVYLSQTKKKSITIDTLSEIGLEIDLNNFSFCLKSLIVFN